MALNINTNIGALMASASASAVNRSMETSMERLSTGLRINSAADDAAGVSISTRMEAQIRGLNQAIRNAGDGQSLVDTAEGAMVEITNMLQRMRELSVQASNDTLNTNDRTNLNTEVSQLKFEIDRIVSNTRFNDIALLDGTLEATLQLGAKSAEDLTFAISNMSTSSLGTTATALTETASVTASAMGTPATSNVVNLTFNNNGTYSFDIALAGENGDPTADANSQRISISGDVTGFSARDIAQDINNKIALTGAAGYNAVDLTGILTASYSGNTVSLVNKAGTSVDIENFDASGTASMVVNPVTQSDIPSATLEAVTELDSLANDGGQTAVASEVSLQLEEGFKFQFEVNNTTIVADTTARGLAASGLTVAQTLAQLETDITTAINNTSGLGSATVNITQDAGNHYVIEMEDATGADINISAFAKQTLAAVNDSFVVVQLDVDDETTIANIAHGEFFDSADQVAGGTPMEIAAGDTARLTFGNADLQYEFQFEGATYTLDGINEDINDEITRVASLISIAGGLNVTAINNAGSLEITNNSGAVLAFDNAALDAPGFGAVAEGDAFVWESLLAAEAVTNDDNISDEANVTSLVNGAVYHVQNGSEAVASVMALTFSGDDRYTFDIAGDATRTITADISNGSLNGIMNAVNAHSDATGVTASIDNNSLILTKADGAAFDVEAFEAEDNGQIFAANAAGQGGSATLQNTNAGGSISIDASGAAVATEVELSIAGVDTFSFKISDGASTATVRARDTSDAGADGINADVDTADLLAEINLALDAANMSHITASVSGNDDGTIILTNALGGRIDISNFSSDGSGTMTVSPNVGQGVAKILNDDALSEAQDAVSSVDVLTTASAQNAMQTIDRALENINSARSELGAISNRLDHTISNLTNVSINTSAAQSRIQDADFAAESTQLAKSQILQQASMAMLAQANASKQGVLSLLQG